MQTPTAKTPVSKCLDLAAYSVQMFGKFPANVVLASLAAKLSASAQTLDSAQTKYAAGVKAILPTRVDVKYENYVSDRRVRLAQQKAEIADGKKTGPIAAQAFPEGSAKITRLLGMSQVSEMVDLEGRLAALAPLWPDAATESKEIGTHRKTYEGALTGRTKAGQAAGALRAVRDVAKESFLTMYAEVMSRVEAEFPRDPTMQELFFDDVRSRSAATQADENEAEQAAEGEKAAKPD